MHRAIDDVFAEKAGDAVEIKLRKVTGEGKPIFFDLTFIGKGGQGVVYQALLPRDKPKPGEAPAQLVAIKFFGKQEEFGREYTAQLFLGMADDADVCRKAAICSLEAAVFNNSAWFKKQVTVGPKFGPVAFATVSPFVPGQTMAAIIVGWKDKRHELARAPGADPNYVWLQSKLAALNLAIDLFRDVAAVHNAGVAHRDLKPANTYVENKTLDNQRAVLDASLNNFVIDFGSACADPRKPRARAIAAEVAKRMNAETGERVTAAQLVDTSARPATAVYRDPALTDAYVTGKGTEDERFLMGKRLDTFALAVMLFELTGGRRTYDLDTSANTDDAGDLVWWQPRFEDLPSLGLEDCPPAVLGLLRGVHLGVAEVGRQMIAPPDMRKPVGVYADTLAEVRNPLEAGLKLFQ